MLYQRELELQKGELRVVQCEGWKRGQYFDETDLPWVLPSPNMPTLETAVVYPGQCLLEGTNLSEGRGTTRPFEICGAPWLDATKLARRLNDEKLAGRLLPRDVVPSDFSKARETRIAVACNCT
jgi:uncharacterized protein YbbC (DUF1343 family)